MKSNGPSNFEPSKNPNFNGPNGSNNYNNRPNNNHPGVNKPGNNRPMSNIPGFKGPISDNTNNNFGANQSKNNIPNNVNRPINRSDNSIDSQNINMSGNRSSRVPNNHRKNKFSNNASNEMYNPNSVRNNIPGKKTFNNGPQNPRKGSEDKFNRNSEINPNMTSDGFVPYNKRLNQTFSTAYFNKNMRNNANKMNNNADYSNKFFGRDSNGHYINKRKVLLVSKYVLIAMIIGFIAVSGYIYYLINEYKKSPLFKSDELLMIDNLTTSLYDKNGKLIQKLSNKANKENVPLSKIPKDLQNAFIALEDERFMQHHGVDYFGFARGMVTTLMGSRSGGSTITMQMVRNITEKYDNSIQRKILEMYRAIKAEKRYTKDKILEKYLNVIYMGTDFTDNNNPVSVYGVKNAGVRFFDKDISSNKKLTLAECAVIAGITQNPSKFMPSTPENQARILDKARNIVLVKMRDQGYIDAAQYSKAIAEKIEFKKGDLQIGISTKQSYFVDAVIEKLAKDLSKTQGITENAAISNIYNQGYKITTTMDPEMQLQMDTVFQNEQKYFGNIIGKTYKSTSADTKIYDGKAYNPQAGMVIIDHKNGQVKALYGGRGVKNLTRGNNYATFNSSNGRGPGSSMKPVAVYGPALDIGEVQPGTVIDDIPIYLNGGTERHPKNYQADTHFGMISIRRAITKSNNVVLAKLFMRMNRNKILDYLDKLGLYDKLNKENVTKMKGPEGLNIALGDSINSSPYKMAAAYSTFANNGVYIEPHLYTKVENSENEIIINKEKGSTKAKSTQVFSQQTAYLMTNMLKDVVESSEGTASGKTIYNASKQKIDTAGKTGTTSSDKDRWFVGYTPYYVGAVWFGDVDNIPLPPSQKEHLNIWYDVMHGIHNNLSKSSFIKPTGVETISVCKYSGLLPARGCSNDVQGSAIAKELVNKKFAPKKQCTTHISMKYCQEAYSRTGKYYLPGAYCPQDRIMYKATRQRDLKGVLAKDLHFIIDLAFSANKIKDVCPIHNSENSDDQNNNNQTPQPTIQEPTMTPDNRPTKTPPWGNRTPTPHNSETATPTINTITPEENSN